MKKLLPFIALISLWSSTTIAQTIAPVIKQNILPASVTKTLFNKEQSFGAIITTSGWGINFRSGKAKGAKTRQVLSLEFTTYRHPKEIKVKSELDASRKYRYGKIATPYFIRASAGLQKVLFDKETTNNIQVRYLLMAGPSLVLAKPYYVDYKSSVKYSKDEVSKQFDPLTTHVDSIFGGASFFTGIGSTLPYPAVHAKAALSFEYASNDEDIKALELGANIDFLPIPIKVFAFENRRPVFFQIYVSFNFGSRWY